MYEEHQTSLVVVEPPAAEPFDIFEARTHLRCPADEDDDLIERLIMSARRYFEEHDNRRLVFQTVKYYLDCFPRWTIDLPLRPLQAVVSIKYLDGDGNQQTLDPLKYLVDRYSFVPRITPAFNQYWPTIQFRINAVEITFICGYDYQIAITGISKAASAIITTSTPHYLSVGDRIGISDVAGMVEINGKRAFVNAIPDSTHLTVSIDSTGFTTYASGGKVLAGAVLPDHLKSALLLHVGHLYENRENTAVVQNIATLPMGYDALVGANRRIHV